MYQGGSDDLLGAHDDAFFADTAWGIDFEAELAVITGDVRMGASARRGAGRRPAADMTNDWSLRELIPAEMLGFLHSRASRPPPSRRWR